jgi:hypothetical protein
MMRDPLIKNPDGKQDGAGQLAPLHRVCPVAVNVPA